MRRGVLAAAAAVAVLGVAVALVVVRQPTDVALLVVLGLVAGTVTVVVPRAGLFLLLVAMLFSPEIPIGKLAERAVTVRADDVLLVLIVVGWLVRQGVWRRLGVVRRSPTNGVVLAMSVVIVISVLVGLVLGTVTSPARGFFFGLKRLEYFVVYLMVLNVLETEFDLKLALVLFGVSLFVIDLIALAQYWLFPLGLRALGGVTGPFGVGEANTLAGFYLLIIPVVLALALKSRRPSATAALVGLGVLSLLCLLLTKSRGAYVALPPALLVLGYGERTALRTHVLALLLVGVVGVTLLVVVLSGRAGGSRLGRHAEQIGSQFRSIGAVLRRGPGGDPSLDARVRAWREKGKELTGQLYPDQLGGGPRPRGGVDPEVFLQAVFGQGVGAKRLGWIDNHYVREVLETGLLGLVVFLWLNVRLFLEVRRLYLRSPLPWAQGLAIGFLAGQVGLLVHSVTVSSFYTIRTMEPFWFLVGCLMLHRYHLERSQSLTSQTSLPAEALAKAGDVRPATCDP